MPGHLTVPAGRPCPGRQRRQHHGAGRARDRLADLRSPPAAPSRSPPASAPGSSPIARSAWRPGRRRRPRPHRRPRRSRPALPVRNTGCSSWPPATPRSPPRCASRASPRAAAPTSSRSSAPATSPPGARSARPGRHIGEVLAACVSLLNLSMIVVGGIVAEAGEHLLAGIREVRLPARSLPLATQHLRIVTTRTGAGRRARRGRDGRRARARSPHRDRRALVG